MNLMVSSLKTRKAIALVGASLAAAIVLWYFWQKKTSQDSTHNGKHDKLSILEKQKIPIIVAGPSGVGKGTLLKRVQ